MNNLIKKGVIKAFRVHIDYSKLGLEMFKLDIYLKDHKQAAPLMSYLSKQSFVQCLNIAIGWADIEPEFIVKNITEVNIIMDDLNKRFPNAIRRYSIWMPDAIYKEREMPEMTF